MSDRTFSSVRADEMAVGDHVHYERDEHETNAVAYTVVATEVIEDTNEVRLKVRWADGGLSYRWFDRDREVTVSRAATSG